MTVETHVRAVLGPDRVIRNVARRRSGGPTRHGRDCEDVVTQFAAVSKAPERASVAVVANGLQQCLTAGDGVDSVDVKKIEKLSLA